MLKLEKLRPGSFGVVIDDFTLTWTEAIIEAATGDGIHTWNYHGNGIITESLMKEGVVEGNIKKYLDGKSVCKIFEPKKEWLTDEQVHHICFRWRMEIGKKYDYIGNIKLGLKIFKRLGNNRRKCSHHTAHGIEPFLLFLNKRPARVSPNDTLREVLYSNFENFNQYTIGGDKR